jgi:hypothetical protein
VTENPFPKRFFYVDPNTGAGRTCDILAHDDGRFLIRLGGGAELVVTAGDLYVEDESGRYLGGPGDLFRGVEGWVAARAS